MRYARTKRPEHLEALLLIAALATLILWLLGLAASEDHHRQHTGGTKGSLTYPTALPPRGGTDR